jgi:hypothetical protein
MELKPGIRECLTSVALVLGYAGLYVDPCSDMTISAYEQDVEPVSIILTRHRRPASSWSLKCLALLVLHVTQLLVGSMR